MSVSGHCYNAAVAAEPLHFGEHCVDGCFRRHSTFESMILESAGGGGRGKPSDHDPSAITIDKKNGLVS